MSFKADIPTLSANEVYTLTFEYEGTETIQLMVGDLTLETTDRRVVFTTTSPVNYIESNVKLKNLELYEGCYESDDFGGEYTQESIIEGRSLVNLWNGVDIAKNGKWGFSSGNANFNYVTATEENTLKLVTGNDSYIYVGNMPLDVFHSFLKENQQYTVVVDIFKNNSQVNPFEVTMCYYQQLVKGTSAYDLTGGITGRFVSVVNATSSTYNNATRYWGYIHGDHRGAGTEIEWRVMILEGDYYDEVLNGNINSFYGIGCVKSPMVVSKEEPNNLFYMKDWTSTLNGGTAYSKDGKIYFSGNFSEYTYFDMVNGGKSKNNIYLEPGKYYIKMKARTLSPAIDSGTKLGIEIICSDGSFKTLDLYTNKDVIYDKTLGGTLTTTSPIVKVNLKIWYGGDRSDIVIEGFSISKVDEDYTDSKYSVVSTPDDLELYCNYYYSRNTKKSSPCYQDTLDLTTGTVTRKNIKVRLNDVIGNKLFEGKLRTVDGVDMVNVSCNHYNATSGMFPAQINGEVIGTSATGIAFSTSQGGYDGHWNPVSEMEHAFTSINTLSMYFNLSRFDNIDYTNSKTITNWVKEQDFTLIIKIQDGSVYTEQLSLNVLESYRNGSITTSSQQLVPTLKTTLPISNKFTQTNLSSGQTYNIYFEGTATKLDAGGTIITNPVSPCEVECGGTTLTIEGTDIQNIRVLETTVKNEVGNNGTSDVELNKVITSKYENLVQKITFHEDSDSITTIHEDDSFNVVASSSSPYWSNGKVKTGIKNPKGINLYHVEFDVDFPTSKLFAKFQFGYAQGSISSLVPLKQYNFRELKLNNDTASICQSQDQSDKGFTTYISQGHFSKLIYSNGNDDEIIVSIGVGTSICSSDYVIKNTNAKEGSINGYTPCTTQGVTISNFKVRLLETNSNITDFSQVTSSLRTDNGLTVIWQDMDMSMPRVISKLEQPIKLRSLGSTYDSYNLTTGELIKRIGVSETDGSYSVLSSPIVTYLKTETPTDVFGNTWITKNSPSTTLGHYINETNGQLGTSTVGVSFYTHDYLPIPKVSFKVRGQNRYKRVVFYDSNKVFVKGFNSPYSDNTDFEIAFNDIPTNAMYVRYSASLADNNVAYVPEQSLFIIDVNGKDLDCCDGGKINVPYLYANGQVKVYSDSEVYPTTILNGQSTNNYEINELKTSDNYTIRYDGVCESINLANKSNAQGTNRIVKSGATSGNLTFVNNSGDINNVLLVQGDVREQEINHFTGVQTVEVSRILIQSQNQSQYIDLPQPVQLNSLPDGTCDTYNPITGEYVQRVGSKILNDGTEFYVNNTYNVDEINTLGFRGGKLPITGYYGSASIFSVLPIGTTIDEPCITYQWNSIILRLARKDLPSQDIDGLSQYLKANPLQIFYPLDAPNIIQLTPIEITTPEGGVLQLITTGGKVFPMVEYSMPTNNRYDTSTWEAGAVYTQRNMTEAYFNESTTPMIPTETMTLTTDHISSGSIILNDNGNGLIVLKGNYTGRDIPYFTGMRSVEAIEIETTPSPDQPLFGKGGRK